MQCFFFSKHILLSSKVYKVLVKLPDGRSYFIFRRYNEFYNLYEKVIYVIVFYRSSVGILEKFEWQGMWCSSKLALLITKLFTKSKAILPNLHIRELWAAVLISSNLLGSVNPLEGGVRSLELWIQ